MGNNFKGLANLGHKKTAFTGGMLTAATGMDLLLPVPVYQRAVHWGIGGLVALVLKVFSIVCCAI